MDRCVQATLSESAAALTSQQRLADERGQRLAAAEQRASLAEAQAAQLRDHADTLEAQVSRSQFWSLIPSQRQDSSDGHDCPWPISSLPCIWRHTFCSPGPLQLDLSLPCCRLEGETGQSGDQSSRYLEAEERISGLQAALNNSEVKRRGLEAEVGGLRSSLEEVRKQPSKTASSLDSERRLQEVISDQLFLSLCHAMCYAIRQTGEVVYKVAWEFTETAANPINPEGCSVQMSLKVQQVKHIADLLWGDLCALLTVECKTCMKSGRGGLMWPGELKVALEVVHKMLQWNLKPMHALADLLEEPLVLHTIYTKHRLSKAVA